ncbi:MULTISPECIES: response regulator transcription factor [Bacillus]|uniref:response regulator transcription factor n=1 Tax=Bacillus TaxID=1386 RepID=UPI000676C241|nr:MULTISPECIES: response regulator transcription factor [Bacillus]AKR13123.1 LuxR family transcriptional regulator [Bacillus thuringiensis]KAB2364239.1 response regulator transcription factor [Bacillus thuringiensis]MCU5131733.1 response regulator transcription factor [Bacillus cereus]MCU5527733.1 response regulator transcription factor [Bacillus cereus]MCU5544495.1 response regulator transcription factor [Bacillus cereus]
MQQIRVMLVEDDTVWMKCLKNYIEKEEDILIVRQAYTEEEALQGNIEEIDIILLDITLSPEDSHLNGLEVAKKLTAKGFNKIIMSTSWDEKEIILEAFDNGAINYVTKQSYKDIPKVIREAFYDKNCLHSDVSAVLVDALKIERKARVLTPSEREVFYLKESGLSKTEIAKKLFKSAETIKKQLQKIYSKIK